MNRNQEYIELVNKLEQIPSELEYTMTRVKYRIEQRRKVSLRWKIPIGLGFSIILSFIILVNAFPTIAFAMSEIPFLSSLVRAVSFDPSMKKAIENDYVQYVGKEQSEGDVTVKVEYMIVDAQRISIFYQCDIPKNYVMRIQAYDADGKRLVAGMSYSDFSEDGLQEVRIDMAQEHTVPREFTLQIGFYDSANKLLSAENTPSEDYINSDTVSQIQFKLYPDTKYIDVVNSVPIKQWVTIEDQKIYIERLDVYPTQSKLILECNNDNTSILRSLDSWLEDDNGNQYMVKSNGVVSTSEVNNDNISSLWFESSYFTTTKNLTLYITGATLQDKDKMYGYLDYEKRTITNLPEGVTVQNMYKQDSTLFILLDCISQKANHVTDLVGYDYWINGISYSLSGISSYTSEDNYSFNVSFQINDYSGGDLKLKWIYASNKTLGTPIIIKLSSK